MTLGCPLRCSVTIMILWSSSLHRQPLFHETNLISTNLNWTRLTAVKKSQVYKHFPDWISHNFIELSAAPETMYFDLATWSALFQMRNARGDVQSQEMDQMVPLCPLNVPNLSPFDVNQTLNTGSFPAVNSRSPSALYRIWVRERTCPVLSVAISSVMVNSLAYLVGW
jgi:hypothetical protein